VKCDVWGKGGEVKRNVRERRKRGKKSKDEVEASLLTISNFDSEQFWEDWWERHTEKEEKQGGATICTKILVVFPTFPVKNVA